MTPLNRSQKILLVGILLFTFLLLVSILADYLGLTKRPKVDYLDRAANRAVEQNHQDIIRWKK